MARKKRIAYRYEPSDADRQKVLAMAAHGMPHRDIAEAMAMGVKTLRRHFLHELENASTIVHGKVVRSLVSSAVQGNVQAQMFWLKCRAGWKEGSRLELTGKDGEPIETHQTTTIDLSGLDHDERQTLRTILERRASKPQ